MAAASVPWWRDAVIYQIYPRSFADNNGDGMGDLAGISAKIPYLKNLGVDAIWLSPFYVSPQNDAGYDVADYRDVDPLFGTLEDFDSLLARTHELDVRVIVDLVPNHTSDRHDWFVSALAAAPDSPERARYIFRDGKGPDGSQPPNNWQSVFGGNAWTRTSGPDGAPGQWYLHLFDSTQPDLNWENPEVQAEMVSVLKFWLDRGVDGFRIDVAHGLVKADGLPDWAAKTSMVAGNERLPGEDALVDDDGAAVGRPAGASPAPDARPAREQVLEPAGSIQGTALQQEARLQESSPEEATAHPDTPPYFDQDGVHEIYRDWHKVLAEYDGDRMLVTEAWVEPAERLFAYVRPDEMQQAFNFDFLLAGWDAQRMARSIDDSLAAAAAVGAPSTWVLSNHDTVRHSSRYGLTDPTTFPKGIGPEDEQPDEVLGYDRGRAAALVMLALPGSAYVYQGDELGLPEHTTLPAEVRQDPAFFRTGGEERGRDGCRVPIPWRAEAHGFGWGSTQHEPWLPQPEGFARYAADRQVGVPGSSYELYRAALGLRAERKLGHGSFEWAAEHNPASGVLSFRNGTVQVLANLGSSAIRLPAGASVLVASTDRTADSGSLAPNAAAWLTNGR